jgi:tripartite-type tricarboxylate transporter receptor subunit TctC
MKIPRRGFLCLAANTAILTAVSRVAYPSRPVRLIVGFAAAGGTDIPARLIGQWLSERLGQQFIIENRPGAGSSIAAEAVVRAPADGYTLLVAGIANAVNATLYEKLRYSFIRDLAPVAAVVRTYTVAVVNPSSSMKTVPDLIAHARANPGKVSMASAGVGSGGHLAGELFKMMAGIDMVHVPYRSAGAALTDLIGGQVQVAFPGTLESIEYVRAGTLRALALASAKRSDAWPDVPTVSEFLAGYDASGWFGIVAPKNTAAEIIARLNREVNIALVDPRMQSRIVGLGGTAFPGSPADFGKLIADETEKWGKVVRAANIKVE